VRSAAAAWASACSVRSTTIAFSLGFKLTDALDDRNHHLGTRKPSRADTGGDLDGA
jgi:hypothetical protein